MDTLALRQRPAIGAVTTGLPLMYGKAAALHPRKIDGVMQ